MTPNHPPDRRVRTRAARRAPAGPSPSDAGDASEETVIELILSARDELPGDDFAAVLVVVGREVDILRRGGVPARPRGRLREAGPELTPEARSRLRPIRAEISAVARSIDSGGGSLFALATRIAAGIERVAASRAGPAVARRDPGPEAPAA